MQKILIIGYLGREPELKYSPQGAVVSQFSVASTERWKDRNGELQCARSGSRSKLSGVGRKSPASTYTKAAVFISKAASALSPGRTRKRAGRITGTLFTWTGSSSLILEQTAMGTLGTMRPATSEAQFQTKKCRSKRNRFPLT